MLLNSAVADDGQRTRSRGSSDSIIHETVIKATEVTRQQLSESGISKATKVQKVSARELADMLYSVRTHSPGDPGGYRWHSRLEYHSTYGPN